MGNYEALEQEFLNVYMQTSSSPLGSRRDAWNWIMDRICYFKNAGLDREKLRALEMNAVMYLTEQYVANFAQFEIIADTVAIVVHTCEELLMHDNAQKAIKIISPCVEHVLSMKDTYLGKKICFQNKWEATLLALEFEHMKNMPITDENYTYLFVLYCRVLDNIPCQTPDEIRQKMNRKRSILDIAVQISPWNATVWEALSRTAQLESEYRMYIETALRYAYQDGEPYGLGTIYANMALHYATENPNLAQALSYICKKYNGNPAAADYVIRKTEVTYSVIDEYIYSILKANNVQIGYSDVIMMIQKMYDDPADIAPVTIYGCPRAKSMNDNVSYPVRQKIEVVKYYV